MFRTTWFSLRIFVVHRQTWTVVAVIIAMIGLMGSPAEAAPIAVRFPEGVAHGFLLVRSLPGRSLARVK